MKNSDARAWECVAAVLAIVHLATGCASVTTAKGAVSSVEERFLTPPERWERRRGQRIDALDGKLWPLLKAPARTLYDRFGPPNKIVRRRTPFRGEAERETRYADEVWLYDGRRFGGPVSTIAHFYICRGIVEHAEATAVRY
jgi:hypothetical protein